MCLGGPNHCRVGWVGSQSYYLSIVVVHCFLMIEVRLGSSCCHHCCMRHVRRCISTQNIMYSFPCTHAHTKNKNKKILHLFERSMS